MPSLECQALDFLVSKGLRDFQAAGVVGNLMQESGLNPQAVGDAGISHGIAQWNGARWQALQNFAQQTGKSISALETQLEFLWQELPSNGLDALKASQTLEAATVAFQDKFERCGTCNTPARIAYAWQALSCSYAGVRTPDTRSVIGPVAAVAALAGLIGGAIGFAARKLKRELATKEDRYRKRSHTPTPRRLL